jgi:hypothetical protein
MGGTAVTIVHVVDVVSARPRLVPAPLAVDVLVGVVDLVQRVSQVVSRAD